LGQERKPGSSCRPTAATLDLDFALPPGPIHGDAPTRNLLTDHGQPEVSKATIYRWRPTKETLALDALYHEWAAVPRPSDTGSLRGDLLSLLRP
jgi:hypothetical protein